MANNVPNGQYLYAQLPAATSVTPGTIVSTFDQGLMIAYNGVWTGLVTSSPQSVLKKIMAAARVAAASNSITNAPWNAAPAFASGSPYGAGSVVSNANNIYACVTFQVSPGNAGVTAPTGTSTIPVSDGTLLWTYQGGAPTAAPAYDAPVVTMTTVPGGLTKNFPTVTGGVIQSTFTYVGGTPTILGAGVVMNSTFDGTNQVCQFNRLGFSTDAPQVFINLSGGTLPYIPYSVEVNGRFTSPGPIVPATAGASNGILLDWSGSAALGRKVRDVTLHLIQRSNQKTLLGVNVDPLSRVWPLQNPNRYRICIEGDSLLIGAGAQDTKNLFPVGNVSGRWTISDVFAGLIGCDDVVNGGITSTGFVNPGTTNTYIQRLPTLAAQNPNVLVVMGNHNDTSYTSNQRQSAITAYLQAARAALPNAIIVMFGPWPEVQSGVTAMQNCDTDMYTAVKAFNDPYVVFYSLMADSATSHAGISVANSWSTGTGYSSAGHQNSSGNSDNYVGPDQLHTTNLGSDYLGRRYAEAYQYLMSTLV